MGNMAGVNLTPQRVYHLVRRISTDKRTVCGRKVTKAMYLTMSYSRVSCKECISREAKKNV